MSSLQQYMSNALSVDDQESSEEQNYKATKDQLKAMGEGLREQALGSLPFSIAEVSRGVSGLYRTFKQAQDLVQRKGGLGDLLEGITKGSDEPFDIGKLANRVAGAAGDQIVARYGAEAKRYGVDLGAIRDASKSGGIDGAIAQTKTQLGAIADKNIARASTEIDRGVGQFTAAVGGKAAELQSAVQEFSGKSLDELKTIQSRFGETLRAYSPADISNLSEAGRAQYKQLTDIVGRGDATPEGLARLKTGTQSFTQRVGLEQEVGRLTRAKNVLSEQATQARQAVSQKTRALTDEHEAKLSAADERLSRLQTQKETSEDIVAKARGRLTQQSEDILKAQPTEENLGGTSSYRTGGSMNIGRQVRQSQSSIDEALIAKHQNIAEGLDRTITETQAGKQQMISQFNSKVEEATAPIREQLAQIAPKIQSATEVAESLGQRASAMGSAALEGLGHVAAVGGLGMGLYQAGSGQLQTAGQKVSAGLNIAAGGKQVGETIASKLAPKTEAPAAAEGEGLSTAEQAAKAAAEASEKTIESTATKGAVTTGAELGTEAAAEAGSSVLPVIGEAVDIGLGLAMGIQSLVDIFGGRHDQPPPPPPSQVVSYQHQEGIV
jgi:hypothetical protein